MSSIENKGDALLPTTCYSPPHAEISQKYFFKYPHHITQRSNRREDVFFSKEDRQYYPEWLGIHCQLSSLNQH